MSDEDSFDIGRDQLVFLVSVLDKTEYICQNDEEEGAAEAHAEVIDQSIRMLSFFYYFFLFFLHLFILHLNCIARFEDEDAICRIKYQVTRINGECRI